MRKVKIVTLAVAMIIMMIMMMMGMKLVHKKFGKVILNAADFFVKMYENCCVVM